LCPFFCSYVAMKHVCAVCIAAMLAYGLHEAAAWRAVSRACKSLTQYWFLCVCSGCWF
jgi:hypothetical protein